MPVRSRHTHTSSCRTCACAFCVENEPLLAWSPAQTRTQARCRGTRSTCLPRHGDAEVLNGRGVDQGEGVMECCKTQETQRE